MSTVQRGFSDTCLRRNLRQWDCGIRVSTATTPCVLSQSYCITHAPWPMFRGAADRYTDSAHSSGASCNTETGAVWSACAHACRFPTYRNVCIINVAMRARERSRLHTRAEALSPYIFPLSLQARPPTFAHSPLPFLPTTCECVFCLYLLYRRSHLKLACALSSRFSQLSTRLHRTASRLQCFLSAAHHNHG